MYDNERIHLIAKLLTRSVPQQIVFVPDYDDFEQEKTIDLYLELLDMFKGHESFKVLEAPDASTMTCRRDSVEEVISFFKENLENGKSVGLYSVNIVRVIGKESSSISHNIRCSIY
jgi:hypothetical protein